MPVGRHIRNGFKMIIDPKSPLYSEYLRLRSSIFVHEKQIVDHDDDNYDNRSTHIVVLMNDEIAGFCRVIHPSADLRVTSKYVVDRVKLLNYYCNPRHVCEISRFGIIPKYRHSTYVLTKLIVEASAEALKYSNFALIVTQPSVKRLLETDTLHFVPLGPLQGERKVAPYLIKYCGLSSTG